MSSNEIRVIKCDAAGISLDAKVEHLGICMEISCIAQHAKRQVTPDIELGQWPKCIDHHININPFGTLDTALCLVSVAQQEWISA